MVCSAPERSWTHVRAALKGALWSLSHPSSVKVNTGKPLWRATLVVVVASDKHTMREDRPHQTRGGDTFKTSSIFLY